MRVNLGVIVYVLLTANYISCWLCYPQQYVTFLPLSHSNSFKKGMNSESSYGFTLSKFYLFLLFPYLTSIFFNFMRISNYLSVPFHRCSTCLQFPNMIIPALSDHSPLRVKKGLCRSLLDITMASTGPGTAFLFPSLVL